MVQWLVCNSMYTHQINSPADHHQQTIYCFRKLFNWCECLCLWVFKCCHWNLHNHRKCFKYQLIQPCRELIDFDHRELLHKYCVCVCVYIYIYIYIYIFVSACERFSLSVCVLISEMYHVLLTGEAWSTSAPQQGAGTAATAEDEGRPAREGETICYKCCRVSACITLMSVCIHFIEMSPSRLTFLVTVYMHPSGVIGGHHDATSHSRTALTHTVGLHSLTQ